MPAVSSTRPTSRAWADLPDETMTDLMRASRSYGWREALERTAGVTRSFARRLADLGLGNWHMLRPAASSGAALDLGCGFGSLALGLADHYAEVVGVEPVPDRVAFAALRARQEDRPNIQFIEAGGHELPFEDNRFDLVTLNGVLEWAALFREGEPEALQRQLLQETRRVLSAAGTVSVAIENRFALATLTGLADTHTGVHAVPALPRWLANLVTRRRTGKPFRTYLYSRRGYHRLMRSAGFADTRVLDLVSSYNDYDFIVDPADGASYRFLWSRRLVRSFYRPAELIRSRLARIAPRMLGEVSYAYLVLGGRDATTVLEASHPFWNAAASWGIPPGPHRFACRGGMAGELAVVIHDGRRVLALVELGRNPHRGPGGGVLAERLHDTLGSGLEVTMDGAWEEIPCRISRPR